VYVLLERVLPLAQPTPSAAYVVPDVDASVIALRPDGSLRPGWSSTGVHVAGFPVSYHVNEAGTVFVASGANPFNSGADTQSQMTITATWLGACAAGQKPGDVMMPNGMTMNVLQMQKLAPPKRP